MHVFHAIILEVSDQSVGRRANQIAEAVGRPGGPACSSIINAFVVELIDDNRFGLGSQQAETGGDRTDKEEAR
jgi:hypothetical protein